MTTALEGDEGSESRPGRSLPPGKTRYPLYRRLGGPQGRSGQVRKISSPTGIRSPDLPARSQSLYRLSYPSSRVSRRNLLGLLTLEYEGNRILRKVWEKLSNDAASYPKRLFPRSTAARTSKFAFCVPL